MNEYRAMLTFEPNEPFDINEVIRFCNKYPNQKLLIQVENTKGITSNEISKLPLNVSIRIAGANNEQRLENYKDVKYVSGETCEEMHFKSVIYTRNETIKILEEIEKMEKGINKNWDDLYKLIYIYDKLKSGILYDPKHEKKSSREIRSLRGLITKQTVCAGYSIILKEMLDRQGITCHYVQGKIKSGGGHAWNVVSIDGKLYPIDLTWDNNNFGKGQMKTYDYLAQNIDKFNEDHIPNSKEPFKDYQHRLSTIDINLIKKIDNQFRREKDFQSTTYYGDRLDGTEYLVSQVGNLNIDGINYYRYVYADKISNGQYGKPIILYSTTNISYLINAKKFGRPIPDGLEYAIDNILFSEANINDSIKKGTFYIGNVSKQNKDNKKEWVTDFSQISKPDNIMNLFRYQTRIFTRSDGTTFIAQQMNEYGVKIKGYYLNNYDIFEIVRENGKNIVKRNMIFSERHILSDSRKEIADKFLSRSNIDSVMKKSGGYIGYYDANGNHIYNPDLISYFSIPTKKEENLSINKPEFKLPTFEKLKELALKYDILQDDKGILQVREIDSGKIINDNSIKDNIVLANIWLMAAGLKWQSGEKRPGQIYAFNDMAEKLYYMMCKQFIEDAKTIGKIDTVKLFNECESIGYSRAEEIVTNIFRSPYQTDLINKIFLLVSKTTTQATSKPETLYTLSYASNLAYNPKYKSSAKR